MTEGERTEEEVEWINRIRTMEKLDRELFTKKETFYAVNYESEKEIRDISKMVKDSWTTRFILLSAKFKGYKLRYPYLIITYNTVKCISERYKIACCDFPMAYG